MRLLLSYPGRSELPFKRIIPYHPIRKDLGVLSLTILNSQKWGLWGFGSEYPEVRAEAEKETLLRLNE